MPSAKKKQQEKVKDFSDRKGALCKRTDHRRHLRCVLGEKVDYICILKELPIASDWKCMNNQSLKFLCKNRKCSGQLYMYQYVGPRISAVDVAASIIAVLQTKIALSFHILSGWWS